MFRQILYRGVKTEIITFSHGSIVHTRYAVRLGSRPARGAYGTLVDTQTFIGNNQVGRYHCYRADTHTFRTRAVGGVERKHSRRKLGNTYSAIVTGIVTAEHHIFAVNYADYDNAVSHIKSRFNRVGKTAFHSVTLNKSVNHDVYIVLFLFVEFYQLTCQLIHLSVNSDADKTVLSCLFKGFYIFTLSAARNRRHNLKFRAVGQSNNRVCYLVNRGRFYLLSAFGTVRNTDVCI